MTKKTRQVVKSRKRNKDKAESKGSKLEKIKWWQWIPIAAAACAVLGFLINNFVIQPMFSMQEKEHIVNENLVMSNDDFPPANLVYSVTDNGEPQSAYQPSLSYTLYTTREIVFFNPIIWAPRRTYYPTHTGSQLDSVIKSQYLVCQEVDDAAVTVWTTARRSSAETSSIKLTWKLSHYSADSVILDSQTDDDTVRVYLSNPNNYHVLYLALVKSPPIRANNVYNIKIGQSEQMVSSSEALPKISWFPESLQIQSAGDTENTFKVNVPVVVEMGHNTEATFDIRIDEQLATISLCMLPSTPAAPAPLHVWVWIIVAAGAISVIIVLIVVMTRR